MAAKESLSGGIAKNLLGNVIAPVAGLASAPILAHTLGVTGRGDVAAATAPFLLIVTLATLGVPDAVTYFVARNRRVYRIVRRRAFWILLLAGVLASIAGIAIAPLLASGRGDLIALMTWATFAIVPTVLVASLRAVAAGQGRWTLVAIERSIGPVLRLAIIGALALADGLDVFSATIAIVASPIVGGFAYLIRPRHRAVRVSRDSEGAPGTTALLNYGMRVWLGSVAGVLLMRLDQVLMVPLSSSYELGLYVVAVTIGELPLVVNTAIREVMFASDARSSSDQALTRAARLSLIICFCAAMVLALPAIWWVPWLFGAGFSAAIPTIYVLLLAVVAGVPGSIAGSGLAARGLPQLRSSSLVAACVINLVVMVALVPLCGALGAAFATLIGNLVSSNLNVLHMRRKFGVPFVSFYRIQRSDVRSLVAVPKRLLSRLLG